MKAISNQRSDGAAPAVWGRGQELTDQEFSRLTAFVRENTGITITGAKRTMLQARLQKRLRLLGMSSFSEYCDFLFSPAGAEQETASFINAITTNKTDFFREPHHFEYLIQTAVPSLLDQGLLRHRWLNVWSAACSSGEEAYTLAMVLTEFAGTAPGFGWSVLGTDISTRVLDIAAAAVYSDEDAEPIPEVLKRKYLLRSKDRSRKLVKIVPALRARVEFRRLNFMQEHYDIPRAFEVIFCRNALIYFDRPTQNRLLGRFLEHLVPGGYLILGHSESLNGFAFPLETVAPTVYRKMRGRM